jgi:CMP-N-acetylneuraminic acid synthetase
LFLLGAAKGWGFASVIRPPEKVDTGKTNEVRDALQYMVELTGNQYDVVCDLDATNPNRTVEQIQEAIKMAETLKPELVVSVTESRRSPYFNQVQGDPAQILFQVIPTDFKHSQDVPKTWDLNSSIYVYSRDFLLSNQDHKSCLHAKRIVGYVMPPESFCDIDTALDFRIVEFLMGRKK